MNINDSSHALNGGGGGGGVVVLSIVCIVSLKRIIMCNPCAAFVVLNSLFFSFLQCQEVRKSQIT